MTRRVYVPLDGSARADSAIAPGAALARRTGAELVLMSACPPDGGANDVRDHLEGCARQIESPVRTYLVLDRAPGAAIVLAAGEPDALLCMATRGRGVVREAVLGSVAEEVVRSSPAPVVLVGPDVEPDWSLSDEPLVVAGIDGSQPSRLAAREAGELALSIGGRVRAVEVVRASDVRTVGEFPHADRELLSDIARELEARGVPADFSLVDGFDPADMLIRTAQAEDADLIAVASHGRSGLGRAVLGSVAMRTVRHAPCPVLVAGPRVEAV
jgi:nucleotide-binding universal stress UspA family protein